MQKRAKFVNSFTAWKTVENWFRESEFKVDFKQGRGLLDDRITFPDTLKRVVLIYSANWSGSTMIGAVLGASDDGPFRHFHVGEIHAYNNPQNIGSTYGNPKWTGELTNFWSGVRPQHTATEIMAEVARTSECESYIDSSKITDWLDELAGRSKGQSVDCRIVVGYRPFASIGASALKRGHHIRKAVRTCSRYLEIPGVLERLGRTQVDAIVDTDAFVQTPQKSTEQLCDLVGIPYFSGKEHYWNYPTAHLFGSRTQRLHYQNPETGGYLRRDAAREDLLNRNQRAAFQAKGLFDIEERLISGELGPMVR